MAGKRGAPRQPLSQRRPKVASDRARPTAVKRPTRSATSASRSAAAPSKQRAAIAPVSKKVVRQKKAGARKRRPGANPADVYARLLSIYPDAHCELDYRSPLELLVATILSAQCTDRRVNMVTPTLFAKYPTVDALAAARPDDVEEIIKSTGFFRAKTKSILGMANALVERHEGRVPATLAELVELPGVGRKTANVVLGNAFDINEGVVVDTHVARVGFRLGLTTNTDPIKIEQDLMRQFPQDQWTMLSHLLIWHGRRICDARAPKCERCVLNDICPSSTTL
jgi:endonuclease-3